MKSTIIIALLAAALLVAPTTAGAEWYMGKRAAQRYARDYTYKHYDSNRTHASCRPQGRSSPESGYIYHRWVCYWVDDYSCEGVLLIAGSRSGYGYYYARPLRGQRCP